MFSVRCSNRFGGVVGLLLMGWLSLTSAQEHLQLQRQDYKRVEATAYSPLAGSCAGVAVISPGAGGSEKGYRYLGDALSALGYLAVVVAHQESGRSALREQVRREGLRGGLAELITDPDAYRGRLQDIAAARKWADTHCNSATKLLIGHSMGAATAMIDAGARNKVDAQGSNSFTAYIALSPQGVGSIFPQGAWSDIRKPVLMLTGTRDTELGGASWETRTEPYKDMPPGCKWLGVIDGASHLNFAGNGLSRKTELLTVRAIGAFLDGIRTGDCKMPSPSDGMNLISK